MKNYHGSNHRPRDEMAETIAKAAEKIGYRKVLAKRAVNPADLPFNRRASSGCKADYGRWEQLELRLGD